MTASSDRCLPSHGCVDSQPGRILAIDYGRRRIGLALSDELGMTARPLETLERRNRVSDLRRLRELVRRHEVRRILVGHAVRLDGTAGEMAAETAQFAARLGKALGVPVELVDERLTSWEARQVLADVSYSRRRGRSTRNASGKRLARKHRIHAAGRADPAARPSRLRASGAVDGLAASVFLQDYLEQRRKSVGLPERAYDEKND